MSYYTYLSTQNLVTSMESQKCINPVIMDIHNSIMYIHNSIIDIHS